MAQIVCKNGQGTDGHRFYISRSKNSNGDEHYHVTFKKDGLLHRTDGPASIQWDVLNGWSKESRGIPKTVDYQICWHINGKPLYWEQYIQPILDAEYDELPLHMNPECHVEHEAELLKEIVKARLLHLDETVVDLKPSKELDYVLQMIGVTNVYKEKRNHIPPT